MDNWGSMQGSNVKKLQLAAIGLSALTAMSMSGCGSTNAGPANTTIKVAYQQFGNYQPLEKLLNTAKSEVEKANPGTTVTLVPIKAAENDYYTKLSLMNKSASTAPDIAYEDTFLIKSDAAAGYLLPLDDYLSKWPEWNQFVTSAQDAGKGDDGKIYGVSMGTDTRALWYNKELFQKAGITVPWQPKTWQDIITAAQTIKDKVPGVMPLNVYSGKAAGEASSMQGFEMLNYGTPTPLFDSASQKWVLGSQGFKDSLAFIHKVYSEGLTPTPQQALDAQINSIVGGQWLPQSKLAIALDGSWLPSNWGPTGATPWPGWEKTMATAAMPTQNGQAPGSVSMSGGWTLSVGAKTKSPDLAVKFLETALNQKNSLSYDIDGAQIAVRKDVMSDPAYKSSSSAFGVLSDVVAVTKFRPANTDYPKVSNNIQVAMEAVMTGQQTVDQAAQAYDQAVSSAVGPAKTTGGK
ncbi:multiple sugar transport system substrate-binding protein [Arthrobacter silviterrae]|uniref:extracellular solute-binding protein n=1 Tax=Arthrobacter silviterrae TaxID=2026658 RepID=UPI001F0F602B|nr:extracellular solute-binding protein [Arthrobacter silviterrae]MDQ0276611.1 multiple sugar transport system substrate-binding protein [Arthrobacter silviterrae]